MTMFGVIVITVILLTVLRILLRFFIHTCKSKEKLDGKTVIVTGANSGIGYHVAKDLARRGARVILACRRDNRGIAARDAIILETGNSNVVYKNMDLASLASVRRFCEDVINTEERLDILVNNAGVFGFGRKYTEDGIVEGMQINHFGLFLLTELLLPLLKKTKPSKIVNVSSLLHFLGNVNADTINKCGYPDLITYSNSKLCSMTYTVELAERLKDSGVTVNAVHPGVVLTNIGENVPVFNLPNMVTFFFYLIVVWVCMRSAEEGAQPVLGACLEESRTGKFIVDGAAWPYSWRCYNRVQRINLWRITEDFVNGKVNK